MGHGADGRPVVFARALAEPGRGRCLSRQPASTPRTSGATSRWRQRDPRGTRWRSAVVGARFPWDPASTILRRPPFAAADAGSQLGRYAAYPLLVLGDDVTTDHISPASAIPPDSLVADFLVERGDDRDDLNVFASRRGNWEVMLRAASAAAAWSTCWRPVRRWRTRCTCRPAS